MLSFTHNSCIRRERQIEVHRHTGKQLKIYLKPCLKNINKAQMENKIMETLSILHISSNIFVIICWIVLGHQRSKKQNFFQKISRNFS